MKSAFGVSQKQDDVFREIARVVGEDLRLGLMKEPEKTRLVVDFVLTGAPPPPDQLHAPHYASAFRSRSGSSLTLDHPPAEDRAMLLLKAAGHDLDLTARYLQVCYGADAAGTPMRHAGMTALQALRLLFRYVEHSPRDAARLGLEAIPPQGLTKAAALALAERFGGGEKDLWTAIWDVGAFSLGARLRRPSDLLLAQEFGLEAMLHAPTPLFLEALGRALDRDPPVLQILSALKLEGLPAYLHLFIDRMRPEESPRWRGERRRIDALLSAAPRDAAVAALISRLSAPEEPLRREIVRKLVEFGGPDVEAALEAHPPGEKSAKIRRILRDFLAEKLRKAEALAAAGSGPEADLPPDDAEGYAALGGARIAIPPLKPFLPGEIPVFGAEEEAELRALIAAENESLRAEHAERLARPGGESSVQPVIAASEAAYMIARLNGDLERLTLGSDRWFGNLMWRGAGADWLRRQLRRFPQREALRSQHRLVFLHTGDDPFHEPMTAYLSAPNADLRQIEALAVAEGQSDWLRPVVPGDVLAKLLGETRRSCRVADLPRDLVWPLVAANLHVIEDVLSPEPVQWTKESKLGALAALELLPATPRRFLPQLTKLAFSLRDPGRMEARRLLAGAAEIEAPLYAMLEDPQQETRLNAVRWIAQRRSPSAEAPLRARLKKEKTPLLRAAMIEALRRMGASVSAYLGPEALEQEAEAGLRRASGEKLEGGLSAALGGLRWRDGRPLPEPVLRWWVHLALRLKRPSGEGVFALYLDELDPEDAQKLGRLVLEGWLAEQIREEDPAASASKRDEVLAQRGILALALRAPPVLLATRLRGFLKSRHKQVSACQALVEYLGARRDPPALQLLQATAERHKKPSVRRSAAEVLEEAAQARDWTLEELADRTVPDLGLDETGRLDLPWSGGESYLARLDENLALALENPAGRKVKALPKAEDEAAAETRKAFLEARKILAETVVLQSARLREAMCAGRIWAPADWREIFLGHPVLRKMAQRLVWLGLDAEGAILRGFRPTPEGDVIDAADAPVDPAAFAGVKLGHAALTDEATDALWTAHLKDYEVAPLFGQFGVEVFRAPEGALRIEDRAGWVTEAGLLLATAENLGYQRGPLLDSGSFKDYRRSFSACGLTAVLLFSGSHVFTRAARGDPAAILHLSFQREGGFLVPLAAVPPALLSECWRDYRIFAAKGAYDPDWRRRF